MTVDIVEDATAGDATVFYRLGGDVQTVATIGLDGVSLGAEEAMERGDMESLNEFVAS